MVDAARICEQLGVEHHIVDSRDLFETNIVNYLVEGYSAGITPLPCSQCNRAVKFGPMLAYAQAKLGIDRIATGHYARLRWDEATGRHQLLRAVDRQKDQSYFLYDLPQDVLAACLFPLGHLTKAETRQRAAAFGLVTAEKPESQDLCLIESHGSMQAFLDQYLAPKPGDIVNESGQVLGQHQGIHHYTVGQRKGLGIAAPQPLYVVAIDVGRNQVVVGTRDRVHQTTCIVDRVNWVSMAPPTNPIRTAAQVRYRAQPTPATVIPLAGDRVRLQFDDPEFGITPGQAAVWYDGDVLLGGGILAPFESEPSA